MQLTVARTDGKFLRFNPQGHKAIIGPRTYNDAATLVTKFRFRKNIRAGCILIRPCLCTMVSQANRTFCPAHGFWASIRPRLTPGDLLFPNISANMFNQRLKKVTRDLNYVGGHRFPPHAFRRGATQEISNSGSILDTVLKSGMWGAACYKSYLDLRADEAANIFALLATALNSDSVDPDIPPDQQDGKNEPNPWQRLGKSRASRTNRAPRPLLPMHFRLGPGLPLSPTKHRPYRKPPQ